jgi:pimeloyl-ACP methyl ester carboxylesterase
MASQAPVQAVSHFVRAADGLWLHAREYGPGFGFHLPVLCLPGLARTARDFEELASALALTGRRVLALDYRGRGRSDYDSDPARYAIPVESQDILTVAHALGVPRAVIIGTSRGGLHAMTLAATEPGFVAGAVLNDIGPVVEAKGLLRIKGYVGKGVSPVDHATGAALLKRVGAAQFPNLSDAQWLRLARLSWVETATGTLVYDYDLALAGTVAAIDETTPNIELWSLFDALIGVPLMALRGGLSDILSETTLKAMAARHPGLEWRVVPDQGHAPLLDDEATISAVVDFVQGVG